MYYYYHHPHCCFYVNPCYPTFTPYPYQQHLSLPYTSSPYAPSGYDEFNLKCCKYRKRDGIKTVHQECQYTDRPCRDLSSSGLVLEGEPTTSFKDCPTFCPHIGP